MAASGDIRCFHLLTRQDSYLFLHRLICYYQNCFDIKQCWLNTGKEIPLFPILVWGTLTCKSMAVSPFREDAIMKAILRLLQGLALAEVILGIMGHTSAILRGVPCLYIGIAAFAASLLFSFFCVRSKVKVDDTLIETAAATYDQNLLKEMQERPDSFTANERYQAYLSQLAICFVLHESKAGGHRVDFLSSCVSNFNIKEFKMCLAKLRNALANALRDPERSFGPGAAAAATIECLMLREDIQAWVFFYTQCSKLILK